MTFINPFAGDVFPPRNLPGTSEEWGRSVESRIESGDRADTQISQTLDNNLRAVSGQLEVMSRQLSLIENQQRYLVSLQRLEIATSIESSSLAPQAWMTNPPTVTISSPTGRVEISFGGRGLEGRFVFGYEIRAGGTVIRSRDSVVNDSSEAVMTVGGINFASTGFNTVVREVPINTPLTISLQVLSGEMTYGPIYFLGGRIMARVAPGNPVFD